MLFLEKLLPSVFASTKCNTCRLGVIICLAMSIQTGNAAPITSEIASQVVQNFMRHIHSSSRTHTKSLPLSSRS